MVQESINYFANQVIMLYSKGRPNIEGIDEREVEAWTREALSFVGVGDYWKNYKAMNQSKVEGYWLVTFLITLANQNIEGVQRKVALLTESPLALPKNRGVVQVKTNTGLMVNFIEFDAYDGVLGGSVSSFTNKWFYTYMAGKVVLLPNCKKETNNFTGLYVTQAVSNNATMTESQVMLVYQQVYPLMDKRYGIKPDTKTDDFPQNQ